MPVLLHKPRGCDDPRISLSLDQTLAWDASLDSWSLAHSTLTLLPPFQPPPKIPRPFTQQPTTTETRVHHSHQSALTHRSRHEQENQHHYLHLHRHRDRKSSRSLHPKSLVFDHPVYSVSEKEDTTCAIDISYLDGRSGYPLAQHFPSKSQQSGGTFTALPDALQQSFGRSLTLISPSIGYEMTTVSTAPDSPPDLSSKSSKSSSYHSSSQFSTPDGIVSDISNFEDIGLEDDAHANNDAFIAESRRLPKRPTSHTQPRALSTNKSLAMTSVRDLTTGKRNYPSLRGQVVNAIAHENDESLGLPSKRSAGSSRGFSSPSLPMLPRQKSERSRSRSRSPAPQEPLVASPASYLKRPPPSPRQTQPNGRRKSWQPTRKTIKELEAEYHDSDDDLPEDTNLWNVPMSPRPPQERALSRASSRSGSPERPSPGPPPIPLAHSISAPTVATEDEPEAQIARQVIPPRKSSLYTPPPGPHYQQSFRDNRAKSWTLAMSDLSEEARVITEALEWHADDKGRKHDEKVQQGGSRSARPSLESTNRHPKSMIELPPLQKGNVMIDPLPISKEKEKVLTRTRPSWLPPKNPKEEKRHLKEYQNMMAASIEAEKKRESREQSAKVDKDDARAEHNKVWEQYVYPDWTNVISEHRTRELWWKGVSPKMRGLVWQRAIGNELALTEASYNVALKRAQDLKTSTSQDDETKKAKQWFAEIAHDVASVYPEFNLFQRGLPMHNSIIDVLSAYAMYRNDIGYLEGLHLIAAVILLQISEPSSAFILMANCLNRPLPLACVTVDPSATSRTHNLAHQALSYKFPRVAQYLFNSPADPQHPGIGLSLPEVFDPMFRSLLSNGLELERLSRIWDCWVFEGDRTLVRAAVAVLGLLEAQICLTDGHDPEEKRQKIRSLLWWGPWGRSRAGTWDFRGADGGDEDGFMKKVREAGRME